MKTKIALFLALALAVHGEQRVIFLSASVPDGSRLVQRDQTELDRLLSQGWKVAAVSSAGGGIGVDSNPGAFGDTWKSQKSVFCFVLERPDNFKPAPTLPEKP